MAVTPLSVRGEIIGTLGVQDDPQYPLSQDDLALVESVSEQVALALESAHLFEQTQVALAQTEALYESSGRVVRATAVDDVLQALIHSTTLGRLDRVSIALFNRPWEDEMPEEATISATWERSGEESRAPVGTCYLLDQFPAIETVTRDEPTIFRDITTDKRVYKTLRALLLNRLGMRSLVLWPLVAGGQWIGILNGQAATALEIDEDEIRQITSLTDQAATVIQNIRLFEETRHRAVQLETAAQVSRATTSILDTGQLLNETVNLIRNRFGLYHVGIFLLDEASEYAMLQAGTGEAGQEMLKQGHKLKVGGTSMIGWCTAHGKARIALDVGKEAVRFDNPLLPRTRSEMALPLTSRGRVIGAMTIQSDQSAAFSEEDIAALQTMADQLANAIENTQLFQETKSNLEEITLLHRRYLQETWGKFLQEETSQERAGYMYNQGTVSPAGTVWRPEIGLAVQRGDTIALSDMVHVLQGTVEEVGAILQASPAQSALAVPLKVRGQVIGALDFYEAEQVRDWSTEDIAMVETVANQVALAIENARAYEELQKRADQLKEIDRLKTQFLANMSHELRTPLNSIIGFSRVILKGIDGPITEQQRVDLTSIYNNGQHLLGMINDILDISKIEAGRMELLFEPVDIQQIISGVMSTVIALVKDRPIELKQEVAPDLPTIRADSMRVRQVILNLLSNATKFTEEGHIILRAWADNEQITISVKDTGIGIALEHQALIFEEFRQVDGSSTRRTGGTGLGLAISRHFVEMHGGCIWVESEPGVGSTFTFTLPITGPVPVAQPELAALTIDPSRKLILAVEDDEGAIAIYKRYLEKQGYQIVGLNQGEQAVRWALELSPQAIILDVLLPDKTGWVVLEELKSSREAYQIPVIICTILDDGEARGLSLGAADYLVKPILEEDLLQALHRLEERQLV
jgi:signal transduction histidine kinase/ActR/RegA family two-component response regulator